MIEEYRRVYAEVDLDAIRSNLENMKANIAPDTGIIGVIKTDGYGHGAIPIGKELEKLSYVTGYAVATAEEAFILRESAIKKPILILGYTFPYSYIRLMEEEVRLTVFHEDMLNELSVLCREEAVRGKQLKARIHIKVDTGMSRIGIRPDEQGIAFVKKALETEGIEVEGIFTHFARADEEDKTNVRHQLSVFSEFLRKVREETGREIPIKHCSNSAGILELKEANMDVVRAGITLYGLWPSDQVRKDIVTLKPALSLYSSIVYLKEIEEGTPVSYGGTYIARNKIRVATIPVGYGDGYPRGLSGKGYVLIKGKKAPILGRVCMDQMMADVTSIPGVALGDKVTLIGRDGSEQITMEQLGALSGRFNYELACCLGKRIPRVYIKNGQVVCTKDYYHDF